MVEALALEILRQALMDAQGQGSWRSETRRLSALGWLTSRDRDLRFWCACADVRVEFIEQLARRRR